MNCAESLAELQWHGVPVAGQHAGTRLARRLRLWARGRGASGGSVDDAAASGEGLHRWHRQGGCNSCQLVPISGLFSRASGDLVTALAARQPWCCPCLRIKAAGRSTARLQGLGPRSSTAAAWQGSQGPGGHHTRHSGSLTLLKHFRRKTWPGCPDIGQGLWRQERQRSAAATAAASAVLAKGHVTLC